MTAHSSAPSYPIAQGSKRILLSDMPRGQRIAAIGQLLVGYDRMDWSWDYLLSQDLILEWEVVLYDHIQCRNCHAATPLECRSSLGAMRYTGLMRAGVLMYQRPCFGAIQCLGPISWLAAYNRRVQLGENYLPADARRPIAATAQPAPRQPQAARPYDIAGLTNRVARGFRPCKGEFEMPDETNRRWTNCEDCLHHRPPYMGADPVCEDDEAAMYTRGLVEAIQEGRLHCPRQVPGSQTRGRGRG